MVGNPNGDSETPARRLEAHSAFGFVWVVFGIAVNGILELPLMGPVVTYLFLRAMLVTYDPPSF